MDESFKTSYQQYLRSVAEFGVTPVSIEEYKDVLLTAGEALSNIPEKPNLEYPYVYVNLGDMYMKVKKVNNQAVISYMDKDIFNLTINLNKQGGSLESQS